MPTISLTDKRPVWPAIKRYFAVFDGNPRKVRDPADG